MYAGGPGGDPTWGLMGNVAQPSPMAPMTGLMGPQQIPMQNFQQQAGPWSQVAYQMAGSPNQNPFQGLTLPPASATSPSGGGATALGGTALGILGALAKGSGGSSGSSSSPLGSAVSTLGSKLGGLFSSGSTAAGSAASSAGSSAAGDTLFTSGTADSTADLGGTTTAFGDGATGPAVGTTTTFGDAGAAGAGSDAGLSDVGVDAATADPSVAGVGSGASSGSGLSAGAGAALAFAPLAITAELAMHTHGVQLGDDYWLGYKNPTGTYGSPGTYTQNFLELANGINQGDIPPDYLRAQYPGLYQAAAQMRSLQNGPMSAYWGTGGHGPISQNRA